MNASHRAAQADALRKLHHGSEPVLFVNAWDAVSARIIESLGYPAVATTSAGVAFAAGYADGEKIPRDEMMAAVKRITRVVSVPVTADAEAGYGPTVEDARATARAVLDAGAVGLNFEDSDGNDLMPIDAQEARIAAIRKAGEEMGIPIVINARTDALFIGDRDEANESDVNEAIERGNRYLKAGADCIFVPGAAEVNVIGRLVKEIDGPINILAGGNSASLKALATLGVARVSLGSGPICYALTAFRTTAKSVRETGDFSFLRARMPHAEVNALFAD